MNLLPGVLMFGVAPEILRACAQRLCRHREHGERRIVSRADFALALGAPLSESDPVLERMLDAGYFVREADGRFACAPAFLSLPAAKISKGIPRAEAEALLAKAIARANDINASATKDDPTIRSLAVFGSYLSDKPILGDLDLMVEVANPSDIHNVDNWDRVWRAQDRLMTAMQLRRPEKIGIHTPGEVLTMRAPYRLVLGAISPNLLASYEH